MYFWFCSAVFAIMILAFFVFQPDTAIHAEQNAAENPVKDGLVKEDGCYCFYEDGQRLTNSWVTAGNDTYYFRWDGQASVLRQNRRYLLCL